MSSVNPKGRAPLNLKRKGNRTVPLNERVQLDKVLGLTVSSNASVRTSEATGLVAYPAGCVVVLFNPKRNKQSFLINASKKSITSLAFSPDGKYLATGECGHLPNVRVWDVAERSQVGEFAGHKFAINCVAFSPNNKYVVSIGSQHDMIVNVWNWRAGTKVASNKVACKVKAISFAENGSYFVTAGNRHVKFWYLDDSKNSKAVDTVPRLLLNSQSRPDWLIVYVLSHIWPRPHATSQKKLLRCSPRIAERPSDTHPDTPTLTLTSTSPPDLYLECRGGRGQGDRLLASASRDRLIHVFDMDEDYAFQQTLDDHSASITAVRFTQAPQSELKMFSCSADKSIIFRTAHYQPDLQFVRNHHVFGKTTMYDLDIDPTSKHIVTACQDRNIRVYDIATGKQRKCYKGSTGEDGALIKLSLDPSGLYIATSCSDKNICLFDYSSGECVAVSYGHSELVTGLRFTNDCKNLISVSGDGCIFVWKLNPDLVRNMQIRLAQLGKMMNRNAQRDLRRTTFLKIPNTIMSETEPGSDESSEGDDTISMLSGHSANCNIPPKIPEDSSEETPDCRFSMGQVPSWAQKQMSGEGVLVKNSTTDDNSPRHQPRGRWGQQGTEVKVRSIWDDEQLQQQQQQQGGGGGAQDSPGVSPIPAAIVKRRETFSGTPNSRHRHVSADSSEDEEALMNARNAHTSFSPVKQRRISDNYAASPRYGGLLMSRAAAKSLMNLSSISNTSNTSSERQKLSKLDLSNLAKSLTDLSSFDLDDLSKDAGDQPIVFQLPNEDDSSGETSYKVVEITAAVLREALKQPNQQLKAGSARHENTESPSDEETTTDQGESTDVGEDSSSTVTSASIPTTPSKVNKQFFGAHLEKDHMDKEKFIKSQYESGGGGGGGGGVSNLLTSQEKFGQSLDKMERRMESLVSATDAADHRLSISSRFLQRSQQSSARQLGYVAADQSSGEQKLFQRDSTPDAVFQKRTEELGKAMEATKKRLKSLGWRGSEKDLSEQTIPEKERDGGYERETPSPPTKDTTADTDLTRTKSLPDVSTIGHHRRRPLPTTHGDGESAYVPGKATTRRTNKPANLRLGAPSTARRHAPPYHQP
ncbi:PREDICTED: mitogen-activated protein kinase-binding protein 1-like [Priapulus caudatus]|uniref:Mitogen-activated protein kinase-binding protein 1-like n=1 Tax=Priapulus caudatus TaxID=37621 RepID=A0ABM1DVK2_PRICU|nr:PREDICTED: mitogen-activated protein kinase-binding protein 1-like [Priapulus caudatus]